MLEEGVEGLMGVELEEGGSSNLNVNVYLLFDWVKSDWRGEPL